MRLARPASRRLTAAALVGLTCAFATIYDVGLLPPSVHKRQITVAAASAHVLIDERASIIGARTANGFDADGLTRRADLYANLLASPPVLGLLAARIGVPADRIAARPRLTLPVQWAMRDPDEEQRANQLLVAARPYKLELQADPSRPVLNIYAQAPSVAKARRLADASVVSLRRFLAARSHADPARAPLIQQLGPARGAVVNAQIVPQIVLLAFLVGFGIALGTLSATGAVARGWRAHGAAPDLSPAPASAPVVSTRSGPGGDWPHTTRVVPWLIAGFIALLWLIPFNAIQLSVSLPFDLKLDRIVLPLVAGAWMLALSAGGAGAPRLRMTLVHVGVAVFLAIASLSIALNALALNQTLEFDLAFKKLTLLLSYTLLFVIIASTVRRREVDAYLKYILALAALTSIGVIWEYRFHYNVFYEVSGMLLPGFFSVGHAAVDARDDIGRIMTFGPTDHPLEVCGMLTMALPIALVGIIGDRPRRTRVLCGIAACLLLAAEVSTYRKSALLGPLTVVLVIAYFRRHQLMRLAPFGFVSLIAIHVLSPGAFGSIVLQLHPDRLGVATVSDRASDYDAVRPDLWSHLAFGRGYGSYDHLSYRVLDSEILSRLVDTGILGVLAFAGMLLCMVFAGRKLINGRDPERGGPALAVAAAAVAFLVLAFLFDVSSFPHVPYILLSLGGLLAVVVSPERPVAPERARRLRPQPALQRRSAHRSDRLPAASR